ncbi:hypothetical protein PTKIN_Ptkin05aG0191400 [Pterospermum kingtungense]
MVMKSQKVDEESMETCLLSDMKLMAAVEGYVCGTETSATTIEWAMAELLKNPGIMKKAREEIRRVVGGKGKVHEDDINHMDYLKCIVKEALRLHPPGPLIPREMSAGIKLRGYDILPKTRMIVNVWAIQRDPKLWDRPQVFVPERFENNPIDFRGQNFELTPIWCGKKRLPWDLIWGCGCGICNSQPSVLA